MSLTGWYNVGEKRFVSKIEAITYASITKNPVSYYYFDEVFADAAKSNLCDIDLDLLYKERALQLRDTYDKLVLYYSGGSDSWQILRTFLKYNIKLDAIFCLRPVKATDKLIYTPNANDVSANNNMSEWDYIIKPDLEWLRTHHPNIHIEIGDWSDTTLNNINFDKLFEQSTIHYSLGRLLKQSTVCQYEREKLKQGKTVGTIYGIDKPNIIEKDKKCYFFFVDVNSSGKENPDNPNGLEYFYNTPKFPVLAVQQARKLYAWYQKNPKYKHMILARSERTDTKNWTYRDFFIEGYQKEQLAKKVIYPEWDITKFQTVKPIPDTTLPPGIRPWEAPLAHINEFLEIGKKYDSYWKSIKSIVDKKYVIDDFQFRYISTKWHLLTC